MRKHDCKCSAHTDAEKWHGSSSGYKYHGCDCDICREWNRANTFRRINAPGKRERKNAIAKERTREKNIASGKLVTCIRCGGDTFAKDKICSRTPECRLEYLKLHMRGKRKFYTYGLTDEDYTRLLNEQNGCCALCGISFVGANGKIHIDHNHTTGTVRGLLCHKCNVALGWFDDNPKLLLRAVDYLERNTDG